jgi:hypothetical protein
MVPNILVLGLGRGDQTGAEIGGWDNKQRETTTRKQERKEYAGKARPLL